MRPRIDPILFLVSWACTASLALVMSGCRNNQQATILEYMPESIAYSDLGEVAGARVKELTNHISEGVDPLASLVELAQVYHANGLLREAISCYEGLVQVDSKNAKWPHLLATLLAGYGYAEDATDLWLNVIEREPNYVPARIGLGGLYLKTSQITEAEACYRESLNIDPNNPYGMVGLARLAIQVEDWETAESHLKRAASVSDGKIGKDLLVTVYEAAGKAYEALAIRSETKASGSFVDIIDPWMDEVNEYCLDADQLVALGGAAAFRNDLEGGISFFKRAIEIEPENEMAHFQLAYAYEELRNNDLAIKHLNRAIEYKEDFADAWIRLTTLHEKMGNPAEASRVFYTGFSKCPKSPGYQIEHARRLKGEKKFSSAIKALNKSIELRPNEALPYIELSTCYFSLNQVEKGVGALERALEVEAGNITAMTTLCFYSIMSGNREKSDYWMSELEKHPRFDRMSKQRLEGAFRDAFGGK